MQSYRGASKHFLYTPHQGSFSMGRFVLSLKFQGKGRFSTSSIWSLFSAVPSLSIISILLFLAELNFIVYTSKYWQIPVRQNADVKIILNFKLRSISFVTFIADKSVWCMIYIFTWTCHLFPLFLRFHTYPCMMISKYLELVVPIRITMHIC